MKFAQEFKKSLQREGFPQKWIDSAIPYGQLKKCLKKVTSELHDLGLDKDTLAQLAAAQESPGDFGFQYELDTETGRAKHFRPKLTVFVHLRDGVAVDAELSPATRDFLQRLELKKRGGSSDSSPPSSDVSDDDDHGDSSQVAAAAAAAVAVRRVEVPLVFDGEFFDILQTDVLILDNLQEEEERRMQGEITSLGHVITTITKPSKAGGKKAKDDLAKWRDIFELYLDARIFFSTRETDHGARSSVQALGQLKWFQDELVKRKVAQHLKLPQSRDAFTGFIKLNVSLLQNLKFQEINQLAIKKILKKFDKRTALGVARAFPIAVNSGHLLAGTLAKDLCAHVSTEIISAIPQLDDYLCPICFAIAYWPIRLQCQHVFCSRCLVKMQRKNERLCPLCRDDVIMVAGLNNFDKEHADFLREYFPKEVKEKVRTSELERGKEIFGPDYSGRPCSVM